MDYTGTGNSLNVRHPHSLQLIMDSLRYWVTEMHVDGFRFDLASALAREFYDVDRLATFFELVQQDPVVSQVKLIAEPWDVGPGGYQVGNFPPQWTEWNGAYRDTVRDFWRGEPSLGEFASRLAGSSDLYEHSGRRPFASINFVTAHDGFTLRDLVSYNEKHNEANGEDNNDGESHNRSWNHGVEGPTDDPEILELRAREQRNFLATLLLSQGVPMLLHGDEMGRTQDGNNNTYAQDSEITWVHWDRADKPLIEFTAAVAKLRKSHPTFRRKRFFTGSTVRTGDGEDRLNDIVWLHLDGRPMEDGDWENGAKAIGMYLNGDGIAGKDARGNTITDDHFLLYFNADGPAEVTLPPDEYAARVGRRHRHRRLRRRETARRPAATVPLAAPAAWWCCASTPSPRPSPTTRSPPRWPRCPPTPAGRRHPGRRPAAPPRRRGLRSTAHRPRETMRTPSSTYRLQITERLRPVRGRAPAALPARPRRRLGLPVAAAGRRARQRPRLRRRRPRPRSTRRAAARRAWPRCPPRPGGSGSACSSTSCPTTSASPPAAENPWWWDLLAARPGLGVRRARSTSTGRPATAGSGSRSSATTTARPRAGRSRTSRVDDGELRYHDHRFPIAPGTADDGADADTVHDRQHYELVNWRVADDGLNYRRFFAVNTLAAIRVEDPDVFAESHVEIRRWFDEGLVDGLRVDHPDGLRDPEGYLDDLAELTGGAYVLVEKILEPGEELPAAWATEGTTGYDALGLHRPGAHRPGRAGAAGRARDPARGGHGRLARS